jgi:hypothetical protein
MLQTQIPFEDVEFLRRTDFGFWCRIDRREVFVGPTVPLRGTTIMFRRCREPSGAAMVR